MLKRDVYNDKSSKSLIDYKKAAIPHSVWPQKIYYIPFKHPKIKNWPLQLMRALSNLRGSYKEEHHIEGKKE